MMYRLILLSILFMFLASPSFADPLSDIGLFVVDKDTSSIAWKAGVYEARPTISGVVSGSGAEQAGLKRGDIILSVGGKAVGSTAELRGMGQISQPLVVLRGMHRVTIGEGQVAPTKTASTPQKTSEPPKNPILRIETGSHTDAVRSISTDSKGYYVATVSHDKTARLYDVKSGNLLQTFRPPIREGEEGKLNAVAISPDTKTLAVGGWTGGWDGTACIYFFDTSNGRLLRRISGLPQVITRLVFSEDGRYLAAALMWKKGVYLFNASDGLEVGRDDEYGDHSMSVHFSTDGRLVTSCLDGYIRLYVGADGKTKFRLIAKIKLSNDRIPASVHFSPDNSRIVAGSDSNQIDILNSHNLKNIFSPDNVGVGAGSLTEAIWSADGRTLFAGGSYGDSATGQFIIRRWGDGGKGKGVDVRAGVTNTVLAMSSLPNGAVIIATAEPSLLILNTDDKAYLLSLSSIFDPRGKGDELQFSSTGNKIGFGYGQWGSFPHLFSMQEHTLAAVTTYNKELVPPILTLNGLRIEGWKNSKSPKLNGTLLEIQQHEFSRSLAVEPNGKSFILGFDWHLRCFNSSGQKLWQIFTPSTAWAVNISGNGKYAVVAYADGTLRWYDYATGRELVAFFPHADRKRWVLWTSEGFFDASPGAEDLIGWHLNRGKDREAEFISGSAMYKFFYRPDLVQAKFEGKDISAYLKDFDINTILTQKTLPPKIRFITKPATSDSPDITLQAEVCDNGGGVGDITLYLDNMPVVVDSIGRGLKAVAKGGEGCQQFDKTITLQNGSNSISLMAYNKNNTIESTRDSITITHREAITRKPTLHLLAIAVNSYRDGNLRLKYAVPDAKALAETVQKTTGGLFEKVQLHTIYDADVTKEGIAETFARIGATTRREDVFLLYVAGHGITNRIDGAYYFLPYDFRYTGEDALTKQGVSENDFKQNLAQIQATKSLLLLDTCNSGSFAEAVASRGMIEKTAVNKLVRAVGRATIVASSKDQVALEGYEGHGVFTYTLLEGMKGKAASSDGRITVNTLATFIEETLPRLTYKKWGYEQIPQKSLMGMDFPIGMR